MKRMMKLYMVILTLIVVSVISGCNTNKQESLRVVSLDELEEIPYNLVSEVIEEASDEFIGDGISLTSGLEGIRRYTLKSPRVYFEYLYLDYQVPAVYFSEGEEFDPMNNPNRTRSIEDAHNRFEEQYNLFNDYYEENSDEIIMEIQDDRGYIIFDLEDSETISAISGEDGVSVFTTFYGCIYQCEGVYIEAIYKADTKIDFNDFVSLLDELGLPHM